MRDTHTSLSPKRPKNLPTARTEAFGCHIHLGGTKINPFTIIIISLTTTASANLAGHERVVSNLAAPYLRPHSNHEHYSRTTHPSPLIPHPSRLFAPRFLRVVIRDSRFRVPSSCMPSVRSVPSRHCVLFLSSFALEAVEHFHVTWLPLA